MNEAVKTGIYVGLAIVVVTAAYATRPKTSSFKPNELVGNELFPDFKDVAEVASLQITTYDEELGEIHPFEVAQLDAGQWVIPSNSNYPADAENQIRDSVSGLLDLKVIDVASEQATDHETFGVIEPDVDKLKAGDQGVGTRIVIEDSKGNKIFQLIVGKKVKNAENQRFVRLPEGNQVFIVQFDLDKLSTNFDDWIESDLLQLNAVNVNQMTMKDYSLVQSAQGMGIRNRSEMKVIWNQETNKWTLEQMLDLSKGKPRELELLDDEELNTDKLNAMRTALGDLKIVNVRRKPQGLSSDLAANKALLDDVEGLRSLVELGFVPNSDRSEIYGANGEIRIGMKNAVEYILRFGNDKASNKEEEIGKLNRYLLVMARLDESRLKMPELIPLPETSSEEKDEAPQPEGEKTKEDRAKLSRLNAEKEIINRENERKMNQYRDQRKAAEEEVAALNARFGDWYYVVSEEVYKKLQLTRNDAIRESQSAKESGYGVDVFRGLQERGVGGKEAAAVAPMQSFSPPFGLRP